MISIHLEKLGLNKKEVEVYLQLLKSGAIRASTLAYQLNLPRTTVQNILNRLEKHQLCSKSIQKNVFIYIPVAPNELTHLFENKKREIASEYEHSISEMKRLAPQLTSLMSNSKNLPNVRFYQGKDAVRTVLFDTLTSKTELKDYANIDAMFEHVKDINDEYVAAREKTKITKRSLLLDTPFARQVYESGNYSTKSHKGYKWIHSEFYPFALEMNIYDGKVSYLTYAENNFVGVIIENEYIYQMHNSMWNLLWDLLPAPENK
ncbi:hypothetical protein IPJ72_00530 [Candidatus Peregrinibacteria bacterium]|nr:MAG: hypothetical protein IPJ72_00530 [Candidatus Peregrinibacteria bacterium]